MVVEAIKEGFGIVNRNLPLLLIQIGMMIITFLAFILLVGIPVAIAIVYLGIDIGRFKDAISNIEDPVMTFQNYSGLVIFLITSFILYLTAVTCLCIFVLGGNIGILRDSVRDQSERFSVKKFMTAGKKYFMPLCWLAFIFGIFFLVLMVILGVFAGIVIALLALYRDETGIIFTVIAILSGMILFILLLIGFFLLLAFSLYAVIALVVEELRAWESIKRALRFINDNFWEALGLYLLLIACYIGAVILMMLMNLPFSLIPVIGSILTLPYQLVSSVIQLYLGLIVTAALVVFYMKGSVRL